MSWNHKETPVKQGQERVALGKQRAQRINFLYVLAPLWLIKMQISE